MKCRHLREHHLKTCNKARRITQAMAELKKGNITQEEVCLLHFGCNYSSNQPIVLTILVQFKQCWSYEQLYRLRQNVLEKMKAARDMYSRFQRRVKRLESCYKAKDVSGVSDAVVELTNP
jgi:thiamine kinase-like enzyme